MWAQTYPTHNSLSTQGLFIIPGCDNHELNRGDIFVCVWVATIGASSCNMHTAKNPWVWYQLILKWASLCPLLMSWLTSPWPFSYAHGHVSAHSQWAWACPLCSLATWACDLYLDLKYKYLFPISWGSPTTSLLCSNTSTGRWWIR